METEQFERLVVEAVEALPDQFLRLLDNVQLLVAEWPSPEQLASVGLHAPWQLLGLYEGIPQTSRGLFYGQVLPDRITIFQRPIERICRSGEEIREQVRDTVVHELGHHFGIDEDRMEELEAERDRRRRGGGAASR